jgi:hypothetical protein
VSGKSDKEKHFAEKIENIIDHDKVTDVRLSTNRVHNVVAVKFENDVEIKMYFGAEGNNHTFQKMAVLEANPAKVLGGEPTFTGTETDNDVLRFCFALLNENVGGPFLEQIARYLDVMKDDRVDI